MDSHRFHAASNRAVETLRSYLNPRGSWPGELSSSALSTATAVTALTVIERAKQGVLDPNTPFELKTFHRLIHEGVDWIVRHANADGGWGDTPRSLSNLSTTTLCWAALGAVPGAEQRYGGVVARAEGWLAERIGVPTSSLRKSPSVLARSLIARYGKDRTFSVPILTLCALSGRLGSGPDAWRDIIPLPFELAAFPPWWFAALRLPVVSYALPALIAIGQARFHHAPPRNPLARLVRQGTRPRTLARLEGLQPSNGGFLEATPLTSFVVLSLAGSGQVHHPVTSRGASFLVASQRPDGSWPIDTNLATWLTTLSINALGLQTPAILNPELRAAIRSWLLGQQYRVVHPYTQAAPGGWAWTDLPGGVPDADDTSGAILALRHLESHRAKTREAARAGIRWLLGLQNRDGGIPTFCRGWGALPFDRSSPDLTAHAMRAWLAWHEDSSILLRARIQRAMAKAFRFMMQSQGRDGSWVPLWFGNQFHPHEENPVYGTSRVLLALADVLKHEELLEVTPGQQAWAAVRWLIEARNSDGGWGGGPGVGSSVEETAWAVEGLSAWERAVRQHGEDDQTRTPDKPRIESASTQLRAASREAMASGIEWLVERIEANTWTEPTPVGFYFARLWYWERLYPILFTVAALHRAESILDS